MGKKENRVLFSVEAVRVIQEVLNLNEHSNETIREYESDGWYYHIHKSVTHMNPEIRIRRANYTQSNYKQMTKGTRQCQDAWIYRENENINYAKSYKDTGFIHDGWSVQDYNQSRF